MAHLNKGDVKKCRILPGSFPGWHSLGGNSSMPLHYEACCVHTAVYAVDHLHGNKYAVQLKPVAGHNAPVIGCRQCLLLCIQIFSGIRGEINEDVQKISSCAVLTLLTALHPLLRPFDICHLINGRSHLGWITHSLSNQSSLITWSPSPEKLGWSVTATGLYIDCMIEGVAWPRD